jgi:hypothetical protein
MQNEILVSVLQSVFVSNACLPGQTVHMDCHQFAIYSFINWFYDFDLQVL